MLLKYNNELTNVSLKCYSNSQSRGGGGNISYHNFFFKYHNFTILCHVYFTIVSEQCSQNNFPIKKTNPFKVTNIKKVWWIIRPKCHYFIFVIKNKNKDTHYKYT